MTGNHLADQAQAAENRRGCCPECGRLLEVVDIKIKGKWIERLYCKICDLYFKIED
jgi:transcription elongation factor Elf1